MPIPRLLDAHVHFFDRPALHYPWTDGVAGLEAPAGPAEFFRAAPAALEKLVFVEAGAAAGQHLEEARAVQRLADADPRIAAIVAHAPVEKGAAVETDLAALAELPALRGIRRLIQGEADPGFCLEPAFLEGLHRLARYHLSFDLCLKSWAMPYALELARRCPELSFILDHAGKPDIRHGLRDPWWQQMRELAALPNTICKLSGLITEARQPWQASDIAPYLDHILACFGPGRVLFGSDWPVSRLTHGYADWLAMVERAVGGLSAEAQDSVFFGNAARVYRI
jgi:L-fuconolactonase